MQQKTVQLRLGQGISAGLFNRVLGRHDQKQPRQGVGLPAHGDLPLGHGLQQGRLHLGRGAVDLIGQHQIMKQRPLLKLETARLLAVDLGAGQISRQQIGGKLHPVKITLKRRGQHLDRARLGQPRRALDQQMPVRQERDEQPVDQPLLADDLLADVVLQTLDFADGGHGFLGCFGFFAFLWTMNRPNNFGPAQTRPDAVDIKKQGRK